MLKRKIDEKLIFWKENRKQALLVKGARQVGKTYSIEQFGKTFDSFIEINFADHTEWIEPFASLPNLDTFYLRLSAIAGEKMIPGKTLIFFDEIQLLYRRREEMRKEGKLPAASLDVVSLMKPLVNDGRYRFILSGSLLDVTLSDVFFRPTGYLDVLEMFPLDFEEFLTAKGVGLDAIRYVQDCFEKKIPVDSAVHATFLDVYREYVLIGGMPEAVDAYLKTKNLYAVQTAQENIIALYKADIADYREGNDEKLRLREVYDAIPSELNSKNKRFISSHVVSPSYFKNRNLQDEFLWLTAAGVAIPTYNVDEPVSPLSLASNRKTLKLFLNDIGLLDAALLPTGIRQKLLQGEQDVNYGAPYENAVAEELNAHGFDGKLYYYNSKKHGEVDFLVEYENKVLPIEVKSGKPNSMNAYNHSVLNNLIKMYHLEEAYVLGQTNVLKEDDHIWDLPIYMIFVLKR